MYEPGRLLRSSGKNLSSFSKFRTETCSEAVFIVFSGAGGTSENDVDVFKAYIHCYLLLFTIIFTHVSSVQFVYLAPNYNKNHLKAFYTGRLKPCFLLYVLLTVVLYLFYLEFIPVCFIGLCMFMSFSGCISLIVPVSV